MIRHIPAIDAFLQVPAFLGVGLYPPAHAFRQGRQQAGLFLPVGIDDYKDQIVFAVLKLSCVKDPQGPGGFFRLINSNILESHRAGLCFLTQDRVRFANPDHVPGEPVLILIALQILPVEPADLIVLTVAVIVAALGIQKFIPCQEHGRAPAGHQDRHGIAAEPSAEPIDLRIIGGTFRAAVPAAVVVAAVCIIPAVAFIMLVVVGIQIPKSKSVMAVEEIDGSVLLPYIIRVDVRGSGHPVAGRVGQVQIAPQVIPHIVPVAPVPFRPAVPGREGAHLIEPAGIPGFGDQLDIRQDGVTGQLLQHGRVLQGRTVLIPSQDRGQIKAEAVHMVGGRPVAQAFQDQLLDHGMGAVDRIAAAAEIIIAAIGGQHIIDIVVKALQRETGAMRITFRGVVENNIQKAFDAVIVQLPDQLLQFRSFPVIFKGRGIGRVGGEEGNRIISPVIQKRVAVNDPGVFRLVKLEDGHQFHRVDAQIQQIGNLFLQAGKGARTRDA